MAIVMMLGFMEVGIDKLESRINQQIKTLRDERKELCQEIIMCQSADGVGQKMINLSCNYESAPSRENIIQQHKFESSLLDSVLYSDKEVLSHNMMHFSVIQLLRDKLNGKIHLGLVNEILNPAIPCQRTELYINGKRQNTDGHIEILEDEELTDILYVHYRFMKQKKIVDTTYIRRTIHWETIGMLNFNDQ